MRTRPAWRTECEPLREKRRVSEHAHPFSPASKNAFAADAFEARLRALETRPVFVFPDGEIPSDFRRSSVLLCFWRDAAEIRVLFTKRASTLRGNPGQMAFPGGRLEEGEDWVEAALRETEEEVGLDRGHVEVLGRLDDAWSGSRYQLVPIVGWIGSLPELTLNPGEVASVHTPSISQLLDPRVFSREAADLDGDTFYNDTLRWDDEHVFGLSTDLLIEAIRWGLGQDLEASASHGASRLASLRSWLRMMARA